jgi:hypothetical protein
MRKAAKKPRHTPYAASTPTASDANTAHTNIIESITSNFLCFRRWNRAQTDCGTKPTRIYSCRKFGVRKDGREDFPGIIVAS